jgi:hypothetical protein
MRHEVTHVATFGYTNGAAQTWLVEGAAEYTGYRSAPQLDYYPKMAQELSREGSVPLAGTFYESNVNAHYDIAWLVCAYLADIYGEHKLTVFYHAAASPPSVPLSSPFTDRVLRRVYGIGMNTLVSRAAHWGAAVGST